MCFLHSPPVNPSNPSSSFARSCFGDVAPHVRQATADASQMIMGHLTASGVKLVLPALMKGLEDKAWRTKQGSVQLLGGLQ